MSCLPTSPALLLSPKYLPPMPPSNFITLLIKRHIKVFSSRHNRFTQVLCVATSVAACGVKRSKPQPSPVRLLSLCRLCSRRVKRKICLVIAREEQQVTNSVKSFHNCPSRFHLLRVVGSTTSRARRCSIRTWRLCGDVLFSPTDLFLLLVFVFSPRPHSSSSPWLISHNVSQTPSVKWRA